MLWYKINQWRVGQNKVEKRKAEDEADTGRAKVTDDFIMAGCSSECSILYLKWPQLWSILSCVRKGFHMLIPFVGDKKQACLKDFALLLLPSAKRPVIEAKKKPKRFQSVTKNISSRLCKHLETRAVLSWRTGNFLFIYLFSISFWSSPTFEDRQKRGHSENNSTTTSWQNCTQHNSCSCVAKRHKTLQKLPPALKPQCFFSSSSSFFPGDMVWTLPGPSSHFAVLCLLISSRLSSALLPVTWELIWAHCLQACLNSWNASGGAERGEAAAGAANGDAQMCLVLSSSPHAVWRIKRVTCSRSEQTVQRTDLLLCLALYWLVCIVCFVVTFEAGAVPFLQVTHTFFIYPAWRWQELWPCLAMTLHLYI